MITSVHNPKIQWVRQLQAQAAFRRESQAFVVEGVRLCEEALQAGWHPQIVLYSEAVSTRGQDLIERCLEAGLNVEQVRPEVLDSAAETRTPQGILAVLPVQLLPVPSSLDFGLVLDGLRDPGNLGTILRTAWAAGVQAVWLTPGGVDPFSPKVVRSAMGAHFHLPIHNQNWEDIGIRFRTESGQAIVRVYLSDPGAGIPYTQADFRSPLALVVGGEAEGAGQKAQAIATERVHIPMPGGAESLNAAIAAAILMFEVVKQRQ